MRGSTRLTRRHYKLSLSRQGVLSSSLQTLRRAPQTSDAFVPEISVSPIIYADLGFDSFSLGLSTPNSHTLRFPINGAAAWVARAFFYLPGVPLVCSYPSCGNTQLVPFADRPSHNFYSTGLTTAVSGHVGHVYTKIQYHVTC